VVPVQQVKGHLNFNKQSPGLYAASNPLSKGNSTSLTKRECSPLVLGEGISLSEML